MKIEVNNKEIVAERGETILSALKRTGISVPTLCHLKDLMPTGSCRMCVVEVEGRGSLVPSCSYPVEEGMKINTHSLKVVKARKTIIELLLSNHPDDCFYCERNKDCELRGLAEKYNVRERRISGEKNTYKKDQSSPSLVRDPAKCILCGRCVRICEEIQGVSAIDFVGRGSKTIINTTYNKGLNLSSCIYCGQCILACPTGALHEKSHFPEIIEAISNPDKKVIVQYAPSISVSLAEEFNIRAGKDINGIMNAALRKIGFDKVFDASFTADLTIMEEATEFIERLTKGNMPLPMFTSCCPGWVKYAEQYRPEMLPHLSTCKSPQQMMGALIKDYYAKTENISPENIYSVSVMPCTAKKFEGQREDMTHEGITDVDAVLTTRELARLIRLFSVDINNLEAEETDSPLGIRSTAGKLFGASGGVMEAALRTAHYMVTGKELDQFKYTELRGIKGRKEAKVKVGDIELGVAVVSGLLNARKLIEEIFEGGRKDLHFIEVMTCPGGCINGGGQPLGADESSILARMRALYNIDEKEKLRLSHKNPDIQKLYELYLEKPGSHKSHKLLHTKYAKREVLL